MNVVLQFPVNRVVPRGAVDVIRSAEVVIFPGVRVERRNFKLAKTAKPGRKHRVSQAAIDEDMA
jgi:hypothetical protein